MSSWGKAKAKIRARRISNILVSAGKSWAFQTRCRLERSSKSATHLTITEDEEVELYQQGDVEMYTEAMLDKRFALRHDPAVLQVLATWWDSVLLLISTRRAASNVMQWEEYMDVMVKIYKSLIDEYDAAEAKRIIGDEW